MTILKNVEQVFRIPHSDIQNLFAGDAFFPTMYHLIEDAQITNSYKFSIYAYSCTWEASKLLWFWVNLTALNWIIWFVLIWPRKLPHYKIRIRRAFSRAKMLHPHHHMHHTHNGPIAICLHFEWGWNIVPCIPLPFFLSLKLSHVHEQHEAVSFTQVLGEAPVPAPMIVHIRAPDVVATPIVWTSEDTVLFVSKQTSEVKHKDTFETIQLHLILLLHLASCSKQTKQRTYLSLNLQMRQTRLNGALGRQFFSTNT